MHKRYFETIRSSGFSTIDLYLWECGYIAYFRKKGVNKHLEKKESIFSNRISYFYVWHQYIDAGEWNVYPAIGYP